MKQWEQEKVIDDKNNNYVENNFLSNALGDVGVDETPPKILIMEKKYFLRNLV